MVMSKATKQPALIVLSVVALLNVMFVPIFDVWGGLFPSDVDDNFFEVVEMLFKNANYYWDLWVVQITVSILLPSIFMLIFSLVGARKLFITANVIGILIWFKQIIDYGMEDDGFESLFDFDDCSISIGTWIAIILFVAALITSLVSKGKTNGNSVSHITNTSNNFIPKNQKNQPIIPMKFCPKCGAEIKGNISFCGKCGCKLVSSNASENNKTYEN